MTDLKKTGVPAIDRVIDALEADELLMKDNRKNLDGIQAIRAQIKAPKPSTAPDRARQ